MKDPRYKVYVYKGPITLDEWDEYMKEMIKENPIAAGNLNFIRRTLWPEAREHITDTIIKN